MATTKRNSAGQNFTPNADGWSLGAGTTNERALTLEGSDVNIVGGGSATITFPSSTDTLVARNTTDTLTNKTITGLNLSAGSTSIPPAKIVSGTALTTPQDGAIEYHGGHLYFTVGSTRYQIDQQNLGTLGINIDGNGSVITTGFKSFLIVPYNCTILGWTIIGDVSGDIVFDIWKDTTIPTDADSIVSSQNPSVTASQLNSSSTINLWTTTLTQGDILGFNVDSINLMKKVTLTLKIIKQ